VTNCERYHFADFTRANYRRLLRLAKRTYTFRGFEGMPHAGSYVLWRHDVDFSPHAARQLAIIEAEEGVSSTYFILLHSEFYNLLEREVTDCIRDITRLGHRIGLHFDCRYHDLVDEGPLDDLVTFERNIIERIFQQPLAAFSFHTTSSFVLGCTRPTYGGLLNLQAPLYREGIEYCSDSNGYWRFKRLEDVLAAESAQRLQVLTHAEYWQNEVLSPRQRVQRCIDGRAESTARSYSRVLRDFGREDIDW
jgi:hypothetical protein